MISRVPPVLVCVTIDTEADSPEWNTSQRGMENIRRVPELHRRLVDKGARPTYLVTYPVAASSEGAAALDTITTTGSAEIGAHLHPLETPPFGATESSWCHRLGAELFQDKLHTLTRVLSDRWGPSRSFRAGRYGLGRGQAGHLFEAGIAVDSSVTPFVSWELIGGPNFVGAPSHPYMMAADSPADAGVGPLHEIPVSIRPSIGSGRGLWRPLLRLVGPEARSRRGLLALLYRRMRLVRPVWLRPTYGSRTELVELADRIVAEGEALTVLVMMFHSNECTPGTSPFNTSTEDVNRFSRRISFFLDHAEARGWSCATLSEASELVRKTR